MTLQRLSALVGSTLLATALGAGAAPVDFDLNAITLTPGSGYGVDANEASATLLDVRFSAAAFVAQQFTLAAAGASWSFQIGTVSLVEPNAHGGITAAELDGLGVTATLAFLAPSGTAQSLTAVGTASAGAVNDDDVDFLLSWAPLTGITFGQFGLFDISLNTLSLAGKRDEPTALNATITLRALDTAPVPQEQQVPEPTSLALAGAALLAGTLGRRRRGA